GLVYLGREYRHKTRDVADLGSLLQLAQQRAQDLTTELNEALNRLEAKSNEIITPSPMIINPWLRDAKPYQIKLEKEYNALQVTIPVEGVQKNFYVEMTEAAASKPPIVQHEVRKDKYDTVSVIIPKDRLKNGSYRLKVYPAKAKSLAREYSVQV